MPTILTFNPWSSCILRWRGDVLAEDYIWGMDLLYIYCLVSLIGKWRLILYKWYMEIENLIMPNAWPMTVIWFLYTFKVWSTFSSVTFWLSFFQKSVYHTLFSSLLGTTKVVIRGFPCQNYSLEKKMKNITFTYIIISISIAAFVYKMSSK